MTATDAPTVAPIGTVAVDAVKVAPLLQAGLAGAAVVCAAVHVSAAPAHFGHTPIHGVGFLAVAAFQAVWGAAILRSRSRIVLATGLVGTGLILAAWFLSRTSGIPGLPGGDHVEPLSVKDGVVTLIELATVVGVLALWQPGRAERRVAAHAAGMAVGAGAALLAVGGVVALLAPSHGGSHGASAAHDHAAVTTTTADGAEAISVDGAPPSALFDAAGSPVDRDTALRLTSASSGGAPDDLPLGIVILAVAMLGADAAVLVTRRHRWAGARS